MQSWYLFLDILWKRSWKNYWDIVWKNFSSPHWKNFSQCYPEKNETLSGKKHTIYEENWPCHLEKTVLRCCSILQNSQKASLKQIIERLSRKKYPLTQWFYCNDVWKSCDIVWINHTESQLKICFETFSRKIMHTLSEKMLHHHHFEKSVHNAVFE